MSAYSEPKSWWLWDAKNNYWIPGQPDEEEQKRGWGPTDEVWVYAHRQPENNHHPLNAVVLPRPKTLRGCNLPYVWLDEVTIGEECDTVEAGEDNTKGKFLI